MKDRRYLRSLLTGLVVATASAASISGPAGAQDAQPVCRDATPGPVAVHPGDGVPDPAGRIAYAVVGRSDPLFGPIGTELFAIDPDGSDHVLLLDCDVIRPQWSPDGSRLAFTVLMEDGSWQIATIAADGSDLSVLTSGRGIHEIPSWSPDGTWLAYDYSPIADPEDSTFLPTLWRVDADGTDPTLLGNADTFDVEPRISPDGTQVVFLRLFPEQGYASQTIVRDLATGEERAVTPIDLPCEHPEWSPDGGSIVVNGQDGTPNAATVYVVDLDLPDPEPVAVIDPSAGWGGVKPVFSPDGTRLAVICHMTGEADDGLCLMNADGSGIASLVDDPAAFENHPAWGISPD